MKYRHYKGGVYTYICDAIAEWDRELHLIIYEDEKGNRWCRPRFDFYGYVIVDGKQIRRFEKIEE